MHRTNKFYPKSEKPHSSSADTTQNADVEAQSSKGGKEGIKTEAKSSEHKPVVAQSRHSTQRCRLFIGNLPNGISEDEFKALFTPYGTITEVYLNAAKQFGFIRLDTRHHAEDAKAAVDGMTKGNKQIRVRFATHGAAVKVKCVPKYVTNELLEQAFSQFGDVERAVVIVNDRGASVGEGIVEFSRKPSALNAIRRCSEQPFLLTSEPLPVVVEQLEQRDSEDGLVEKYVHQNNDFLKARELPPRFAEPNTFEYQMATRWRELQSQEKNQQMELESRVEEARLKLNLDMEAAFQEYQEDLLRKDLMRRQEELKKLEEARLRRTQEREMEYRRHMEELERSRMVSQMEKQQQQMAAVRGFGGGGMGMGGGARGEFGGGGEAASLLGAGGGGPGAHHLHSAAAAQQSKSIFASQPSKQHDLHPQHQEQFQEQQQFQPSEQQAELRQQQEYLRQQQQRHIDQFQMRQQLLAARQKQFEQASTGQGASGQSGSSGAGVHGGGGGGAGNQYGAPQGGPGHEAIKRARRF